MCHKVFLFFCLGRFKEIKGSNLHHQWASDCCNYLLCNVREEEEGEKVCTSLGNRLQRWLIRQTHHLHLCTGTLPEWTITKSYTHMQAFAHVHLSALEHSAGSAQVAPRMKCTVYIKRTPLTSPIARKWWCTEIFCHYKGRTKELTWKRSQ